MGSYISVYETNKQQIIGMHVIDPGIISMYSTITLKTAVKSRGDLEYVFHAGRYKQAPVPTLNSEQNHDDTNSYRVRQ